MKKTHAAITGRGSALGRYQDVMVGSRSLAALLYYEFCLWLGPVPGVLGLALRKLFWPRLFSSCGRGCQFAAGITLRHPGRIRLGDNVIISEGCILDGRHETAREAVTLEDNVILSNGVMISCKNGTVHIGASTGLNAGCVVQSTNGCPVEIGRDCIIGQGCLVIGGGSYHLERLDLPIREQGIRDDGGLTLADNVWLGGHVTVLGGVRMGSGSVAAAGAVVTRPVPENSICMGVPACVVRERTA